MWEFTSERECGKTRITSLYNMGVLGLISVSTLQDGAFNFPLVEHSIKVNRFVLLLLVQNNTMKAKQYVLF